MSFHWTNPFSSTLIGRKRQAPTSNAAFWLVEKCSDRRNSNGKRALATSLTQNPPSLMKRAKTLVFVRPKGEKNSNGWKCLITSELHSCRRHFAAHLSRAIHLRQSQSCHIFCTFAFLPIMFSKSWKKCLQKKRSWRQRKLKVEHRISPLYCTLGTWKRVFDRREWVSEWVSEWPLFLDFFLSGKWHFFVFEAIWRIWATWESEKPFRIRDSSQKVSNPLHILFKILLYLCLQHNTICYRALF